MRAGAASASSVVRAAPVVRGVAAQPSFVLRPAAGTLFTIEAHLPASASPCPDTPPPVLRVKYRGELRFVRGSNGRVAVIERVPFGTYLEGLAEVPASWPDAALRAQAIAARSYAIHALRNRSGAARTLGYDICATDACQVYRGANIALGAFGEHWVRAADATKGTVLTYNGAVIPAYYFSTSDGRTRRSFPGGTPEPWLPSVTGEDSDAPLSTWTQRIARAQYDAVLAASGTDPAARLSNSELRAIFNERAPCMFPKSFPGALPQTIPSEEFTASWKGGVLVVNGRGWGHGVGMSQWGARSLAARGRSAVSILRHYYGAAKIETIAEPGEIRVLAMDGMQRVRVSASGAYTATTSANATIAPGDRFEIVSGKELQILRAVGLSVAPVLTVTARAARLEGVPGGTVRVPFTISGAARVRAEIDGAATAAPATSFVAGDATLDIALPQLAPGSHAVTLVAADALDIVRSAPVSLAIPAPVAARPERRGAPLWPYAAGALGALLAAAAALAKRRAAR